MVDDDGNGHLSMSELLMLLSAAFGREVGGDPGLARHIIYTVGKDEHGRNSNVSMMLNLHGFMFELMFLQVILTL